ncbi:MAG: hypothetical protein ABJG88_04500 [Litorimonas sp.]
MSYSQKQKAPWWFWAIGVLCLLWNLVGCGMYLAEHLMSDADYAQLYGPELFAVRDLTPSWAMAGYAVGVWGGFVGIVLLLWRKVLCLPFFYASFVGAVIGFLPSIFDTRFSSLMGVGDYAFMGFIWFECLFIIWFAKKMRARGILA